MTANPVGTEYERAVEKARTIGPHGEIELARALLAADAILKAAQAHHKEFAEGPRVYEHDKIGARRAYHHERATYFALLTKPEKP
jgi:hypothetical protein